MQSLLTLLVFGPLLGAVVAGLFGRKIGEQTGNVGLSKRSRSRPYEHRGWPETFYFQPKAGQFVDDCFEAIAFRLIQFDHVGHQ